MISRNRLSRAAFVGRERRRSRAVGTFVGAVAVLLAGMPIFAAAQVTPASAPSPPAATSPAATAPATTAPAATATTTSPAATGPAVDVIEVEGWIDPVTVRFIRQALASARAQGSQVLLLQIDSPGALLDPKELAALERELASADDLTIAVWVGQAGARAEGGAVRLVRAADVVGLAPGARVGRAAPAPDGTPDPLAATYVNGEEALASGLSQIGINQSAVLTAFIGSLDGRAVHGRVLDTAADQSVLNTSSGELERQLLPVRFAKLGILDQLVHVTTSPTIAYALLLIALALIVFEFFTGGVGVAAGVAVVAFGLSVHGLGLLPTRPVGLVLIGLAFGAYAVDAQTTMPRVWTGIGSALLVAGSIMLFGSADGRGVVVSWWVIAVMVIGVVVFMVTAVPTATRARFSSPVVDRGRLVGASGVTIGPVDTAGTVRIADVDWPASVEQGSVASGVGVRVVAVDGFRLQLEPAAASS